MLAATYVNPPQSRVGAPGSTAVDRRGFLAGTTAACFATALPSPSRAVSNRTFQLGAFEISLLSDGYLTIPTRFLATATEPSQLRTVLAAAGQRGEWIPAPSNVTLVRTGSEVVLIDAGAGPHFMPTSGKLLDSLESAGIARTSITKVVFTRAHPDHIWGTLDDFDDEPNFPNASYVIAAAEWNFWMSEDAASKLPENRQNFAPGAKRNLSRIKDSIRIVQPGEDIVPGLRALDTSRHTAGHIAIEVATGSEGLLVVGDALTHPIISFEQPDWRPAADHHDADRAVAVRRRFLDRLATDHTPLIGYHLPSPGIGRVERKGASYIFAEGL